MLPNRITTLALRFLRLASSRLGVLALLTLAASPLHAEEVHRMGNMDTMASGKARMIGDRVVIACERYILRFAADGRPDSLMLRETQEELLNTLTPGSGFEILNRVGLGGPNEAYAWPLKNLSLSEDGETLVAVSENDTQAVHFRMQIGKSYINFSVDRLLGFSSVPDLTLRFSINIDPQRAKLLSHNHMSRVSDPDRSLQSIVWPTLWTTWQGDDPGGFSLYVRENDADEDETLLDIWTQTEDLVHPKIEGDWDKAAARAWLKAWATMAEAKTSRMILEAESLDDLYAGGKIAGDAGISTLYLMPWVWRGEYWPIKRTNAEINPEIFPNGESDFKAYVDTLRKQDVALNLHWVSGGIGYNDPRYIGKKPDRRLASWGSGEVAAPTSATATEILIRPAPGTAAPYRLPASASRDDGNSSYFKPAVQHWFQFNMARIGDELVRFKKIEDTDRDVWKLVGCERGYGSTDALKHDAGVDMSGLVVPYGMNLVPDNHSTLLQEIVDAKAGMCNRVGIPHIEFDGFEIHGFHGVSVEKFGELIYAGLDHPTTANTSGGRAPFAWFEYNFNALKKTTRRHGYTVVHPDAPSRRASSLLMAHYGMTQGVGHGPVSQRISSGDRGLFVKDFQTHGRAADILAVGQTWREIDNVITPDVRKQIDVGARRPKKHLNLAGNHNASPLVYIPEDRGDHWALVPWTPLPTGKQDAPWYTGQENGPVEPWRYIQPNQDYTWTNPYPAQEPRFVLHVLPAFDASNPDNISLQPAPDDMRQTGDTQFSAGDAGSLRMTTTNKREEERWDALTLPEISNDGARDLTDHRGLGVEIEGDGSGAVLVLQYTGKRLRDYVIPIDFTGKRYIEIPCGEASRAMQSTWGWRFATSKHCEYHAITRTTLGFGRVPAQTTADIKISNLQALKEIPAPLVNPVFKTDRGQLAVQGEVPPHHYLEYSGGDTATVLNANLHVVSELPVTKESFTAGAGETKLTVETDKSQPTPWLEVQFMTHGEPVIVKKP